MLPDANELIEVMKVQIDNLLSEDENLQKFLTWINQKSSSGNISSKPSIARSLYFALASTGSGFIYNFNFDGKNFSIKRTHSIFSEFSRKIRDVLNVRTVRSCKTYGFSDNYQVHYYSIINYDFHLAWRLDYTYFPVCIQILKELGCQNYLELFENFQSELQIETWILKNEQVWMEQCQEIINKPVVDDWQFSNRQKKLLRQYYDANLLLVECLNLPDIYVSREVRQEIEETLLLPIEEINKRRKM
jgi:hypothetical protein